MIGIVLRVAGLTAIYLLVLTSIDPGDVALGALIATGLVIAARPADRHRGVAGWGRWLASLARMIVVTARDIAIGTARVVRFCLGGPASPGFVEVPRGDRSRHGVALWGILTGEAPDEYPVDLDAERDVLIVHLVDAGDPQAVRERHQRTYDTWQRKAVS